MQYRLFSETYGASNNKKIAIAFSFPFIENLPNPKKIKFIKFLNDLKTFLSSNYNYDDILSFMSQTNFRFILWIKKPNIECKDVISNHKNCALSDCFARCYNSIVPNGACGFQLEYILYKRFSLPLDERDDITNSCINAYNKSNLTEFSKHVAKIATDTNRLAENTRIKSKYQKFHRWLMNNKTKYCTGASLPYEDWFAGNDWEFMKYENEHHSYTIFSDPPEDVVLPYIPDYFICDFNAQTPKDNYSYEINTIHALFEDPNLSALSNDHFYLISSNSSLLPDFKESALKLFALLRMIFDIDEDDNESLDIIKNHLKEYAFFRGGKNTEKKKTTTMKK